jgi:hypothetical protein
MHPHNRYKHTGPAAVVTRAEADMLVGAKLISRLTQRLEAASMGATIRAHQAAIILTISQTAAQPAAATGTNPERT